MTEYEEDIIMESSLDSQDAYDQETNEELLDDDEIETKEEAFMRGYNEDVSKIYEDEKEPRICDVCNATMRHGDTECNNCNIS